MLKGSSQVSLSQHIASMVGAYDRSRLDPAVTAKAKACLLDFLCCVFEARDLPWSVQARAITGGRGVAHILGTTRTASAGESAFANAVMGHGLVREDMHAASISHHGVVVWPTLMALAEHERISGERLLDAAIIGYEVGSRIGRALFDKDLARMFRPTGITGPLGAGTAGAYALGLDWSAMTSAIGLAANTCGGLNQWPKTGASDMYFHPGQAARSAVTSVLLARHGAYGSHDILEGEAGLFAAFARRPAPVEIELFPGGQADLLNVYSKPAPACNFAQTACQAALRLSRELGEQADAIELITIRVPDAAASYPGCDFKGPFLRTLQAKMSIQYGVASTLARADLSEANYADLSDREILRLVGACRLETSTEFSAAFPRHQAAEVEVTLFEGRRFKVSQTDVVPATEAEIRARFRDAATTVVGTRKAGLIEDFVDTMERRVDAGRLARLCAVGGRKAISANQRGP